MQPNYRFLGLFYSQLIPKAFYSQLLNQEFKQRGLGLSHFRLKRAIARHHHNVTFLRFVWLCPVCHRTLTFLLPGLSWEQTTGETTTNKTRFEIRVVLVSNHSLLPLIITKFILYYANLVLIVCLYVSYCVIFRNNFVCWSTAWNIKLTRKWC